MKTEVMYFPRELVERGLNLGPSAWTLLSVVLGQTYVKCQVSAEISVQEFADQTTLTEKQIQKALDKLYDSDIPLADRRRFRRGYVRVFVRGRRPRRTLAEAAA